MSLTVILLVTVNSDYQTSSVFSCSITGFTGAALHCTVIQLLYNTPQSVWIKYGNKSDRDTVSDEGTMWTY